MAPAPGLFCLAIAATCIQFSMSSAPQMMFIPVPSSGVTFDVPSFTMTSTLRSDRKAFCQTWNQDHYKTFDGKLYYYNTRCTYILAQDRVHQTFSIYKTNTVCYGNERCSLGLDFYIENNKVLSLGRLNNTVKVIDSVTNSIVKVPAVVNDLVVEDIAHYIFVESINLGFRLQWDGHDYVLLEVQESLRNRTAGLCGFYDDDPSDDFFTQRKTVLSSASAFASSYQIVDLKGEVCQEKSTDDAGCPDGSELKTKAEAFCAVLKTQNPEYNICSQRIDTGGYMKACIADFCSSGSHGACSALQSFFDDCAQQGGPAINWRSAGRCGMQCSNGMVYNRCGSSCVSTCGNQEPICNDKTCIDGCHCNVGYVKTGDMCIRRDECACAHGEIEYPSGSTMKRDCNTCTCSGGNWKCENKTCDAVCSSTGDPHYRTFDGKRFDFHGHCEYYLVKGDKYTITAENYECGRGQGACTKSVSILIGSHVIKLMQGKQVLVDGMAVSVPYTVPGIQAQITHASSMFIQVTLLNGVKVTWDGMTRAYITAPHSQLGKTKGLCGTFNGRQDDDFLTQHDITENNPNLFGNEWKVNRECDDVDKDFEVPQPCTDNVERKSIATQECSRLKSKTFAACKDFVDPNLFYDNCMYDICECQSSLKECACDSFAAYADECSKLGVIIPWRTEISMCGVQCPPGQVYYACGSACNASCTNIANEPDCEDTCIEGCGCPAGLTLDRKGLCVPMDACPCVFDGKEIQPGTAIAKGQQYCTCEKGRLSKCSSTPPATVVAVKPLCEDGLIYTECKAGCQPTCEHPSGAPGCDATAPCRSGCQCPQGFVLHGNKCVRQEQCPCHYHGLYYLAGETVKQDCKTCKCINQKWDCENKVCPQICSAYGESHYRTFDGKEFQFQGECAYVLAQSIQGAKDKFLITTSNVPCGSSGVTCTKSIDISIGDPYGPGSDFHQMHLVRGKAVTVPSGSAFSVSEVGNFILIDTVIGVTIHWDKGTRIYIKLQNFHADKVQGLCGNYNGNQNDDFKARNGALEVRPTMFADSWRVNSHCPPSKSIPAPCEHSPQRRPWAQERCSLIMSDTFKACHAAVPPRPFYDRCEYDACACDYGGDCECLCTAIAAYAQECAIRGVSVHWRSQDVCPLQCQDCDQYTPCMSSCPRKTCDNRETYSSSFGICDTHMCVEGCKSKSCPEGEVYVNESRPLQCIKQDFCMPTACHAMGKIFPPNSIIKDPKVCSSCQNCWCESGQIKKTNIPLCIEEVTTKKPPPTPRPKTSTAGTTTFAPSFPEQFGQPTNAPSTEPVTEPKRKCVDGWTQFMDASYPSIMADGEVEDHAALRTKYSYCDVSQIISVECREDVSNRLSHMTGDVVHCDVQNGFSCKYSENGGQTDTCRNHRIRFYCQCSGSSTPATPPTPVVVDDSSTVSISISQTPGTVDNSSPATESTSRSLVTGDNSSSAAGSTSRTPVTGDKSSLKAESSSQSPVTQVGPTVAAGPTHYTPGDLQSSSPVNQPVSPTRLPICIKTGWTEWMNSDTPDIIGNNEILGLGDYEKVDMLRQFYQFCATPTAIECSANNHLMEPLSSATERGLICNLSDGFVCINDRQPNGKCRDFRVRLYCDCDESTTSISTEAMTDTTAATSGTTAVCESGQEWDACAYKCSNMCQYMYSKYQLGGLCPTPDACVPGCKPRTTCAPPSRWLSESTCVPAHSCSCIMPNGTEAKIGESWSLPSPRCAECECHNNQIQCKNLSFCGASDVPSNVTVRPYTYPTPPVPERLPPKGIVVPPPTPCKSSGYTKWMNTSAPNNYGETESMADLRRYFGFCDDQYITQDNSIECSDMRGHSPPSTVNCDRKTGLTCVNGKQLGMPACPDYVVRFWCSCGEPGSPPHPTREPPTVPTGKPSTLVQTGDDTTGSTAMGQTPTTTNKEDSTPKSDVPLSTPRPIIIVTGTVFTTTVSTGVACGDRLLDASTQIIASDGPQDVSQIALDSNRAWITRDAPAWIMVDLLQPTVIEGIRVQGNPSQRAWIVTYRVLYSTDNVTFTFIQDAKGLPMEFNGNFDQNTVRESEFPNRVLARFVRLQPVKYSGDISTRFDVIGCKAQIPSSVWQMTSTPVSPSVPPPVPTTVPPIIAVVCNDTLSGHLSDSQFSASSSMSLNGPEQAQSALGVGWIPSIEDDKQYLQLDLGRIEEVTGISMQGSGARFVQRFRLLVSADSRSWLPYKERGSEVLEGNDNAVDTKLIYFSGAISTRFIRINPVYWSGAGITLLVEIRGCLRGASPQPSTGQVTVPSTWGYTQRRPTSKPVTEGDNPETDPTVAPDHRATQRRPTSKPVTDGDNPDTIRTVAPDSRATQRRPTSKPVTEGDNPDTDPTVAPDYRATQRIPTSKPVTEGDNPDTDPTVAPDSRVTQRRPTSKPVTEGDNPDTDPTVAPDSHVTQRRPTSKPVTEGDNPETDPSVAPDYRATQRRPTSKPVTEGDIPDTDRTVAPDYRVTQRRPTSKPVTEGDNPDTDPTVAPDYRATHRRPTSKPVTEGDNPDTDPTAAPGVCLDELAMLVSQLNASSSSEFAGVDQSLLYSSSSDSGYGSWTPAATDSNAFIAVDLRDMTTISGLKTRGSDHNNNAYVSKFRVEHSLNGIDWINIKEEFQANSDGDSIVTTLFKQPVTTRFVRIMPLEWNVYVALRFALLGCNRRLPTTGAPTRLPTCASPTALGVQYGGRVLDEHLTASSALNGSSGAKQGRLDNPAGAWMPDEDDDQPWLQVNLRMATDITAVATQGYRRSWVTSYRVQYSTNGQNFYTIQEKGADKVFFGNTDDSSHHTEIFPLIVHTQYLRILPHTYEGPVRALRIELTVCALPVFVPSSSMPSTGISSTPVTPSSYPLSSPTASTTSTPVSSPYCNKWTDFYNMKQTSDQPDGDAESINVLRKQHNICNRPGEIVTDVQCQLVVEKLPWTSGNQTGVHCEVQRDGLRCLNALQEVPGLCKDYEISVFCSCADTPSTPVAVTSGATSKGTRGTPTAAPSTGHTGSPETDSSISPPRTGSPALWSLPPKTPPTVNTPARGNLSLPYCNRWTDFYNIKQTSDQPDGDAESIAVLKKQHNICNKPGETVTDVQCQLVNEKLPWTSGHQIGVHCEVQRDGLRCLNADQAVPGLPEQDSCKDYEISVFCSCADSEPSTAETPTVAPSTDSSAASVTPTTPATPVCKGVDGSRCPSSCPLGTMCNGNKCVQQKECPCVLETGKYLWPGVFHTNSKCEQCHCFMSELKCAPVGCPACPLSQRATFTDKCDCTCEQCALPSQHMCGDGFCIPKTQVCDGVSNCDNDEINCNYTFTIIPSARTSATAEGVTTQIPSTVSIPPRYVCHYNAMYEVSQSGESQLRATPLPQQYKPSEEWNDGNCRSCRCELTGDGKYEAHCTDTQCPAKGPEYDYAPRSSPLQCCAPVTKSRCLVSVVGQPQPKLYEEGETWSVYGNPCEQQNCSRRAPGMDVQTITTVQQCTTSCDAQSIYYPSSDPNVCCGSCKPRGCVFNGTRYDHGDVIPSTRKCFTKKCSVTPDSITWMEDPVKCDSPKRYCLKDEPEMDVSGCCPVCISKCSDCSPKPVTNETLLTFRFEDSVNGNCTGKATGMTECSGFCESRYNAAGPGLESSSSCTCCKPVTMKPILVNYQCDKGGPMRKYVKAPSGCSCQACGN